MPRPIGRPMQRDLVLRAKGGDHDAFAALAETAFDQLTRTASIGPGRVRGGRWILTFDAGTARGAGGRSARAASAGTMNLWIGKEAASVPVRPVGSEFDPKRTAVSGKVRADVGIHDLFAVSHNRPASADRYVEGHVRHRVGQQGRWPHRSGEYASGRPHLKLNRVRPCVANPHLHLDRSRWHRLLDQRARCSQEGQRDDEGDGPQHDAIVASARKARAMTLVPLNAVSANNRPLPYLYTQNA